MVKLWPVIRLLRLDSSLLGFLVVFIPSITRTTDLVVSAERSISLLFICMCAFIANDLDDVEKDRINHPDRPLPTGQLRVTFASALYFLCLGLALFSIKTFIDEIFSFWYYALTITSISYGYVVEAWPSLKAPYVAVNASIPVLIASIFYPEPRLYVICGSLFLLVLGREICMDINDRDGDPDSRIQRMDARLVAKLAFSLQGVGLSLLMVGVDTPLSAACFVVSSALLGSAAFAWFQCSRYRLATILMKCQYLVGLYFLC